MKTPRTIKTFWTPTSTHGELRKVYAINNSQLINIFISNGITRYEEIFGKTWVSVGGETTTREFVELLDLKPGMKVLDIGSGAGGSAFFMARK